MIHKLTTGIICVTFILILASFMFNGCSPQASNDDGYEIEIDIDGHHHKKKTPWYKRGVSSTQKPSLSVGQKPLTMKFQPGISSKSNSSSKSSSRR